MSEETNVIKKTTNYDQFKFIEANREQSRGHIEAIKRAFEEHGNFTRVQPILVNEKYEIIDGQHRFTACRDLGEPIYYTMVPGLGVPDARSMNILHKGWRPDDYALSYSSAGDSNYTKFIQLREDYGFGHNITLRYVLGQDIKGAGRAFRNGEFVLEDEAGARDRLGKLADTGMFVPFVNQEVFTRAFLRALGAEGYDHKHMLRKLELHQHMLERKATVQDALRMLEEIYNFQLSEAKRIRLY